MEVFGMLIVGAVQVKQDYSAAQAQTNMNTSKGRARESTSEANGNASQLLPKLYLRRIHYAQAFT